MPYVYSTMTGGTNYVKYKPSGPNAGSAQILKKVAINGGANLAPLRRSSSEQVLMTPRGAVTKVSDEDLEFLESCEAFQRHKAAGFIAVEGKSQPIDKVVKAGMNPQDKSAPITPKSREVLGNAVAKINPQSGQD